jgi:tetratricopeptide (TPR) repeat protein
MLQGHHPYPGESGIVVAAKLLRDPVPPLDAKKASRLQPSTRTALSTSLERDRDARFASAISFAQALEGKGPPSDTSKITSIQEARRELARQDSVKEAAERALRARRRKAVTMVAALVLLAGGAAAWFFTREKPKESPSRPPVEHGGVGRPGLPTPAVPSVSPGGQDPAAPDPAPVEPQPVSPQPVPPDPVRPDPVRPDPVPPDPVAPEPGNPEPAQPQPVQPDPAQPVTPPPEPAQPVTPPPEPAQPSQPVTPPAPASRDEILREAGGHLEAGSYAQARAAFARAVEADVLDEDALRGVGESFVREADALARSGKVGEAIARLDETVAWMTGEIKALEGKGPGEQDRLRRATGAASAYRAEAHAEKARWLSISGDAAGATKERALAAKDFEFAWQSLSRDSLPYWELLIDRARFAFFEGRPAEAIEDLAITTATNNVEVPAHMWIAHAVGVRRLADAALSKGDKAGARKRAVEATDIVKRGQAYQRATFTRDHLLEGARVLLLNALTAEKPADRLPNMALVQYWVSEAGKRPPPGDEPRERTAAKLEAAHAIQALVEGLVHQDEGKAAEAKAAFQRAADRASAAIAANDALASAGGLLPTPFPWRLLALARHFLGDAGGAQQATAAADEAGKHNPE